MKKASEYRAHARECLSLSKGAELDAQRSTLLQMAADWEEMAAYRVKLIGLHPELAKEGEHEEEGIAPPALAEEG
jgi:hypothetical protein